MAEHENCVHRFFCESKRFASEPQHGEFTAADGQRYALVPTGEPYAMQESTDEWMPSLESLKRGSHGDWETPFE